MRPKWKRWLIVGSAVLLVLVAGIVTWGIWGGKDSAWYSAWASAASAVVAVFALGAASVAAIATIETNRNQARQLERLEESQRREQATKVAVWIKNGGSGNRIVMYQNANPLPIYDVAITFFFAGSTKISHAHTLSPTMEPRSIGFLSISIDDFIREVAGKNAEHIEKPTGDYDKYKEKMLERNRELQNIANEMLRESPISVQVEFSDGESRWRRLPTGRLQFVGHIHTLGQVEETDSTEN